MGGAWTTLLEIEIELTNHRSPHKERDGEVMVSSPWPYIWAATLGLLTVAYVGTSRSNLFRPRSTVVEDAGSADQHPLLEELDNLTDDEGTSDEDVDQEADNDLPRRALEAEQARQAAENPPQRVNNWKQRGEVGPKKAKSLARREQKRAYYEYVRLRADEERQRSQLEDQMFGDLIAEEQRDREAREAAAKEAFEDQRRERKAAEEDAKERRLARRMEIEQSLKSTGHSSVTDDQDRELAESLGAHILESGNIAVFVTEELVAKVSDSLEKSGGRLTYQSLAASLNE